MGDVIELYKRNEKSALHVVREYFETGPKYQIDPQMVPGDRFLAWLWMEGFKVVPLNGDDKR